MFDLENVTTTTPEYPEEEIREAELPAELPAEGIAHDLAAAQRDIYCSLHADTRASQRILYNALNHPAGRLAQLIGSVIEVSDVIAERTQIRSQETGELRDAVHVVLIDVNGEAYTSVSSGIYNAVRKLISVYGMPTWSPALPIKITQQTFTGRDGKPRNVHTLEVVDI